MKEKQIAHLIKKHPLSDVWNSHPEALSNNYEEIVEPPPIEKIIGEMFAIGQFYYYVLNLANSTLSNHDPNLLPMHGLKKFPKHLKEIIELIHPDDIEFVLQAERMTIEKIQEIGWEHQLNLKCSYCFRMKTGKGNYEMFHHQALHTLKDENGRLHQSINIHTNIHHITQKNPYTVLVVGIGERNDFHQMQYRNNENIELPHVELTKRETEILSLLALGKSSRQMSEMLDISYHTITTHRKNILAKTNCNKVSELVKKAFEWALI